MANTRPDIAIQPGEVNVFIRCLMLRRAIRLLQEVVNYAYKTSRVSRFTYTRQTKVLMIL